jgi:hypothetical protein
MDTRRDARPTTRSDLAAADRTIGRKLDTARDPAEVRRLIMLREGLRLMPPAIPCRPFRLP